MWALCGGHPWRPHKEAANAERSGTDHGALHGALSSEIWKGLVQGVSVATVMKREAMMGCQKVAIAQKNPSGCLDEQKNDRF